MSPIVNRNGNRNVMHGNAISRRTFLELAWRGTRDLVKIGAAAAFCTACGSSLSEADQQFNNGQPFGSEPLPAAPMVGTGEQVEVLTPDQEFNIALKNTFPPLDFYSCNDPGTQPNEAEALNMLREQNCKVPLDLKSQLTNDPGIMALTTIALPATALDPLPGDEAIVVALLLLAAAGVMLASVKNNRNKITVPTSHSSPSHDPNLPQGEPARRIIETIVNGGAIERFCYTAKFLAHHPGAEEVVRTIITIGVQGAPYMSHLAWFITDPQGVSRWGGAYSTGFHPEDIAKIAATSKYITSIVRLAADACPVLPGAQQYR